MDFRDADLPEIIKEQIRQIADTAEPNISATQDVPVFTEPPKKDAERTEGKATAEENKETLTEKPQEMVQTNQTAALYRETLATLTDVIRQSSFYDYLRDRETDYDSAAAELDSELAYFVEDIAGSQPELYEAFHSLPKFREWLWRYPAQILLYARFPAPGQAVPLRRFPSQAVPVPAAAITCFMGRMPKLPLLPSAQSWRQGKFQDLGKLPSPAAGHGRPFLKTCWNMDTAP